MSTLTILGIQTHLYWESIEENLQHFSEKLEAIDTADIDLVVLPEMFTTGFSMQTGLVTPNLCTTIEAWMLDKARSADLLLMGSTMYTTDGSTYTNRLLVAYPDGRLLHYDKRYLFTPSGEGSHYESGTNRLICEYKGYRILPLICYDLRFSTWSDHAGEADLIIYTASWPSARIAHWDILLKARAIENLSYVMAVNRIGTDGNDLTYTGHSQMLSPVGVQLDYGDERDTIISATIDLEEVKNVRERLPYLGDK